MSARRKLVLVSSVLLVGSLLTRTTLAEEKTLSEDTAKKLNQCIQDAVEGSGIKPEWGCHFKCTVFPPKCELVCG
jgi:hypothetical protein